MKERLRVVFVSRRNSLRGVLAQACLAHVAPDKFEAWSCGQPGQVARAFAAAAVGALESASMAPPLDAPKSWDALIRAKPRRVDFVIALDQEIAGILPAWPGQPDLATWPFPDIAAQPDGEEAAVAAVRMLYALRRRLELLASLPLRNLDREAVRSDVRDLAHLR